MTDIAVQQMDALDRKATDVFAGKMVRKDLVRRVKVGANAPNYVLAGAANGLGDIWLAQGTTNRDADMIKDALLAYLRGKVIYVPERDSSWFSPGKTRSSVSTPASLSSV